MGPCRRQDKVARPRTSDGCDRVRVLACRSCGRGHRCGRSLPDSQSAPPEPCRALRCKGSLAAGLLNHVVPQADLDAKVDWLIGRIVDKPPTAIRRGKSDAHHRLDVVRREHRLHRKPDCATCHDGRRKGGAQGILGEAEAILARAVGAGH